MNNVMKKTRKCIIYFEKFFLFFSQIPHSLRFPYCWQEVVVDDTDESRRQQKNAVICNIKNRNNTGAECALIWWRKCSCISKLSHTIEAWTTAGRSYAVTRLLAHSLAVYILILDFKYVSFKKIINVLESLLIQHATMPVSNFNENKRACASLIAILRRP